VKGSPADLKVLRRDPKVLRDLSPLSDLCA